MEPFRWKFFTFYFLLSGLRCFSEVEDLMMMTNNYNVRKRDSIPSTNSSEPHETNVTEAGSPSLNASKATTPTPPSNDKTNLTDYGSAQNPAKSCRDLASKNLLKTQPEIYYIETTDKEILQVICPQAFTFFQPIAQESSTKALTYNSSITGVIFNPDNLTNLVMLNGTASTPAGLTGNNDTIGLILTRHRLTKPRVSTRTANQNMEVPGKSVMTTKTFTT